MRRLVGPALLIYSIVLFRAISQAVTLDEADSFNNFANENAFYPSSSNHVLNSFLTRSATQAFGISQFTLRLPSLLGAALYLLAVSSVVTRITVPRRRYLAFAIFTLSVRPTHLEVDPRHC